jgi:uncharacterized membrane protein YczE
LVGLWFFAMGTVMTIRAELGISPWDVLADGLRLRTPLTFGTAVITVGIVLVIAGMLLGLRPGIGTLSNMVLIGVFVDLMLATEWGVGLEDGPITPRVALLVAGVLTIGLGSALYIGAELGAGPRDGLMVLIATRTRWGVGVSRAMVEGTALAVGVVLGGDAGVGTALFALGIGPSVDLAFRLFRMDAAGKRRERTAGSES